LSFTVADFFGGTNKPKGRLNGHQTGSSLVFFDGLITYSKKAGIKLRVGWGFLVKAKWKLMLAFTTISISLWWIFTHFILVVNIITG
jgi:hypothetical protein